MQRAEQLLFPFPHFQSIAAEQGEVMECLEGEVLTVEIDRQVFLKVF